MAHKISPEPAGRIVGSDRVLAVLIELGSRPAGASLEELAAVLKSPKPTIHRALTSLRKASLAQLTSRGNYALGDEFFRLAFRNHEQRSETIRLEPMMRSLAASLHETIHYAVLDGPDVVYRVKVDPDHGAVKLTSTVGGRNPAHRTAVGKILLSYSLQGEDQFDKWVRGITLEAKTAFTITQPEKLWNELVLTRERGFGIDDQENEVGINCIAVPIFSAGSATPEGALSVSALQFRMTIDSLINALPTIHEQIDALGGVGGQPPAQIPPVHD